MIKRTLSKPDDLPLTVRLPPQPTHPAFKLPIPKPLPRLIIPDKAISSYPYDPAFFRDIFGRKFNSTNLRYTLPLDEEEFKVILSLRNAT